MSWFIFWRVHIRLVHPVIDVSPCGCPTPSRFHQEQNSALLHSEEVLFWSTWGIDVWMRTIRTVRRLDITLWPSTRSAREQETMDPSGLSPDSQTFHYWRDSLTREQLAESLTIDEICLFYLLEENDQLVVRLHLGYKDETGQVSRYRIRKKKNNWWMAEDSSGRSFSSVEHLITHYSIYRCLDISTGRITLLPNGNEGELQI